MKRQPSGTPATVLLTQAGVPFAVHAYDHDPAAPSYGLEAATVLGVAPERVFKTLLADADGRLTVAVVPVSGQLDLKALAAATGAKRAAMADPEDAERATGYVAGGISPVGQRKRMPVVVDESARGAGVGEALVMAALARAEAEGAKSVDLTSRPSREGANRLYIRLGFEARQTNVYRLKVEPPASGHRQ